jgi:prepilin-type N-terminal cleavage/methylation domain-containing protein
MPTLLRPARRRGFTLMELGVVLAVSAILAAAIIPDFVEAARTRMAERTAEDVALIHDAARWYFVQTAAAPGTPPDTWPGQPSSGTCALSPGTDPLSVLVSAGYLAVRPVNPWKQDYVLTLRASTLAGSKGCLLQVTTDVPTQVAHAFSHVMPQGGCNGDSGNPNLCGAGTTAVPGGFTRCCTFLPRPGVGTVAGCTAPKSIVVQADGTLKCQ